MKNSFIELTKKWDNTPLFVKYNPGLLDLLVLLDETGLQTVCEPVKFPNKKQANPKFRDVISQTMVYHLLYHVLSNSA